MKPTTPIIKSRGLDDILKYYTPGIVEEPTALTTFPRAQDFAELLKEYSRFVESMGKIYIGLFERGFISSNQNEIRREEQYLRRYVPRVLDPRSIDAFLQWICAKEQHLVYPFPDLNSAFSLAATGMFCSHLIQNSYNAGFNNFVLHISSLLPTLHNVGARLQGKKEHPLNLTIDGNAGNGCGVSGEYIRVHILGNAGPWCGGNSVQSEYIIEGNAEQELGIEPNADEPHEALTAGGSRESLFIVRGNLAMKYLQYNHHCTFKVYNRDTAQTLADVVGKSNTVIFIHSDGKEEVVSYHG